MRDECRCSAAVVPRSLDTQHGSRGRAHQYSILQAQVPGDVAARVTSTAQPYLLGLIDSELTIARNGSERRRRSSLARHRYCWIGHAMGQTLTAITPPGVAPVNFVRLSAGIPKASRPGSQNGVSAASRPASHFRTNQLRLEPSLTRDDAGGTDNLEFCSAPVARTRQKKPRP
jgi:hypothetical protein